MDQYFISYCETQAAGRAPAPRLCAARGCTWRCFPRGRPRPRFCECTRGTRFRANVFILLGHRATRRIAGLHGASILFYFFRRGSPRLTSQISKTWSAYNTLFFSCFTPPAPILLRFRDQTGSGLLRVAGPQTRCFRFSLLRTRQAASAAGPLTAPPGTRAGPRLPTRSPTLAVTCRWDPGHPPGCGVGSDRCGFDLHLPADKWVFFMCLLATCVSLGKF